MAEPMPDEVTFDDDDWGGDPNDSRLDYERINAQPPPEGERITPEELAQLRQAQQIVQQFNANPLAAARQIVEQMGFEMRERGAATPQARPEQNQTPTQRVEDLIEDESLKFLAPMIAKVAEKVAEQRLQERLGPLQQQQQEVLQRNRQSEYVTAAQKLAQRYPDWQSREPDMQARLEFIRGALNGGPLEHAKFGNVLEVLYNWANGNNSAVREVAERYRQAPLNRAPSSGGDRSRRPDILKIVADTKNPQDQMRIAFDEAVREVIG